MRAQNLTISVPLPKGKLSCDKNCSYCVSNMTFSPKQDDYLFMSNIDKVKTVAKAAHVTSVLITSKGETLYYNDMEFLCNLFKEFPIEVQTNGKLLNTKSNIGECLPTGVNVVAFSIDSWDQWDDYAGMFSKLRHGGYVVRVTLNVTDMLGNNGDQIYTTAFRCAKNMKVHQLSFRNVTVPLHSVASKLSIVTKDWIRDHNCASLYREVYETIHDVKKIEIRRLPFGATVYDIDGIAVTNFKECVQSSQNIDDIRSLIYQADGHLYTTWDSPGSILF